MTADQNGTGGGPWGNSGGNSGGNAGGGNRQGSGRRPTGGSGRQEPPDLDDMLRQAQDRFKEAFGGPGSGRGSSGGGLFDPGKSIGLIAVLLLLVWLASGFYKVAPEEDAVILTFGKWTHTVEQDGLGYALPWPIQEVLKVNVAFDRRIEVGFRDQSSDRVSASDMAGESLMVTGDENIIDIDFVVLWKIGDARQYLFEIREPETTVRKVAESAMREIIGRTPIQKALTESRKEIESRTRDLMQKMLDEYKSGVLVNSVQLLKVDPPTQVVDAFDDVQRARADKERLKNEAETYRNDIVPKARGEAQKMIQDAEAYKAAVTTRAEGDADRFLSVYKAYAESKDVTQKRLYLETMQDVLQKSRKVIVGEGKSGPVLPYLPLDQLKSKN